MFNEEFYPTPKEVAERMWNKISANNKVVLDPSCGKGDLISSLKGGHYHDLGEERGYWVKAYKLLGIEIEPDLQAISKEKGISIIGSDFLTTAIDFRIDIIYMNPPFSNGDEHLLKAWDVISPGGTIVCLLNSETIDNPYSARRMLLQEIISKNGYAENWGSCFSTAERPTNVSVSCVVLKKPENKSRFEYKNAFKEEERANVSSSEIMQAGVVRSDLLLALENGYEESKKAFEELLIALSKAESCVSTFYGNGRTTSIVDCLKERNNNESRYELFVSSLKDRAWRYVVEKTKLREIATSKLREDLEKFLEEQSNMAFTKENMISVIEMLYFNQGAYLQKSVSDVFDKMISFDKDNKVHWEGWKTNDAYKVNHKVIMPYLVKHEKEYSNPWSFSYHNSGRNFLRDIDIALCFVTGRDINEVVGLESAIGNQMSMANKHSGIENTKGVSSFFEFQFYKKGTVHLYFRDEETWMRFNLIAAAGKMWLPPNDIKAQEAEEKLRMKKQKFSDAAWTKNQKEKEKRERWLKSVEYNFNPANERGTELKKLLAQEGFVSTEASDSANILIVGKKAKYIILDNTGCFYVYDVLDKKLGNVVFIDDDMKLLPIKDTAKAIVELMNEEEDALLPVIQQSLF